MIVRVENIMGKITTFNVGPGDTVYVLKRQIYQAHGIPVAKQVLVFNNVELKDSHCFSDYSITRGSTVSLSVIARTGILTSLNCSTPVTSIYGVEKSSWMPYDSAPCAKSVDDVAVLTANDCTVSLDAKLSTTFLQETAISSSPYSTYGELLRVHSNARSPQMDKIVQVYAKPSKASTKSSLPLSAEDTSAKESSAGETEQEDSSNCKRWKRLDPFHYHSHPPLLRKKSGAFSKINTYLLPRSSSLDEISPIRHRLLFVEGATSSGLSTSVEKLPNTSMNAFDCHRKSTARDVARKRRTNSVVLKFSPFSNVDEWAIPWNQSTERANYRCRSLTNLSKSTNHLLRPYKPKNENDDDNEERDDDDDDDYSTTGPASSGAMICRELTNRRSRTKKRLLQGRSAIQNILSQRIRRSSLNARLHNMQNVKHPMVRRARSKPRTLLASTLATTTTTTTTGDEASSDDQQRPFVLPCSGFQKFQIIRTPKYPLVSQCFAPYSLSSHSSYICRRCGRVSCSRRRIFGSSRRFDYCNRR